MMEDETPIPPRAHFICDGCNHVKPHEEFSLEVGGFFFCTTCEPCDEAS